MQFGSRTKYFIIRGLMLSVAADIALIALANELLELKLDFLDIIYVLIACYFCALLYRFWIFLKEYCNFKLFERERLIAAICSDLNNVDMPDYDGAIIDSASSYFQMVIDDPNASENAKIAAATFMGFFMKTRQTSIIMSLKLELVMTEAINRVHGREIVATS